MITKKAKSDKSKRSKTFYSSMTLDSNKDNNVHTLSIAFYFIKIQFPQIPVQEIFYLRQLAVKVVSIHDFKKTLCFYVYHEGQVMKGPNELCSFL